MKNSQRVSLKWKNIIVIDADKQPLKIYQLDDNEKLINPIARPKKRTLLYKKIKANDVAQNEKKVSSSLTFFKQVIFSTNGKDKCDISINTDFQGMNIFNEKHEDCKTNDTGIKTQIIDENNNQDQYFNIKDMFESDSNEITFFSDIE